MTPEQLGALLTGILGTGGVGTLLTIWVNKRSKKAGVPSDETAAKVAVTTPDWTALTEYWQKEIATIRQENSKEVSNLNAQISAMRIEYQAQHALDEQYIDELLEHIYMDRGKPPPRRRGT
jgi:hypothetical protein